MSCSTTILNKLAVSRYREGPVSKTRVCGDHCLTSSFLHCAPGKPRLHLLLPKIFCATLVGLKYLDMAPSKPLPQADNNLPGLVELSRDPQTAVCDAPP